MSAIKSGRAWDDYSILFFCGVPQIRFHNTFGLMRDSIDLPDPLKRLFPARIKRPAKTALLSYIFRQAMRDLARLGPGEPPSRELLKKLRLGWDNQGWDAKLDYLEEITK